MAKRNDNRDAGYVFYQSYGSIKTQNKNSVPANKTSQYPRGLYRAEPFAPSYCQPFQYECPAGPVDPSIDYMFPTEVATHPPHFSRFGNPWCPNGYCVGNFPGRYNTPEAMRWETDKQPENVAPARFYGPAHAPDVCMSNAYRDSQMIRGAI